MGFYAPAQLVGDARRNGVMFRPVDVQVSDWDCTLERSVDGNPEVRLGLRLVSDLPEAHGTAIEGERRALGAYATASYWFVRKRRLSRRRTGRS
jgi:error-prone DNA polymerase